MANDVANIPCCQFAVITPSAPLIIRHLNAIKKAVVATLNGMFVILCPICVQQYASQSNNVMARMNGHKSNFRLYVAGKLNKMDNKDLYDHLLRNNIDHL